MVNNKKMQKFFDKLEEKTRGEKIEIELNSLKNCFFQNSKKFMIVLLFRQRK